MHYLLAQTDPGFDAGVVELSAVSARLAYAMMCLTLMWGVLTSMGWVSKLTGRQALRASHQVLATLTLAFAGIHGLAFLMLRTEPFTVAQLIVPFSGSLRITFGVVAFEAMLAASVVVALRRWLTYWRWLWIHRLAYPGFVLGVLHAFFAALANGHLSAIWLGGITVLVPAVTVAALRFMPQKALTTAGLIGD